MGIKYHPDFKGKGLLFKVTYMEKTGKFKLERHTMLHLRAAKQISGWSADDWAERDGKDVTWKKQKQKYERDSCILQLAEKNPLHWQAKQKISAGIMQ